MYDWLREKANQWDAAVVGGRGWKDTGAVEGFINYLERTGATPWPAMCCPDCGGTGDLGTAPDGRQIACETCGGHEDSLGRGFLLPKESE